MTPVRALFSWSLRGKSLLRASFHEALKRAPLLDGLVVDVGGVKQPVPTYVDLLKLGEGAKLQSVNIDAKAQPDIVADAAKLPFETGAVGSAICFNLLEHVADPQAVMNEMSRILSKDAICLVETPFLVNVHGHPDDYWRMTDTALKQMAERAGLHVVRIESLGGGAFLASAAMVQPMIPRILFFIPLALALFLDSIVFALRPTWQSRWPLGYFMVCEKR